MYDGWALQAFHFALNVLTWLCSRWMCIPPKMNVHSTVYVTQELFDLSLCMGFDEMYHMRCHNITMFMLGCLLPEELSIIVGLYVRESEIGRINHVLVTRRRREQKLRLMIRGQKAQNRYVALYNGPRNFQAFSHTRCVSFGK